MVNAFYEDELNNFIIPSVMFGFPLYDETLDVAHAIASLGSVLAHEMAHGFHGRRARHFDQNGDHTSEGLWIPPSDNTVAVSSLMFPLPRAHASRCSSHERVVYCDQVLPEHDSTGERVMLGV